MILSSKHIYTLLLIAVTIIPQQLRAQTNTPQNTFQQIAQQYTDSLNVVKQDIFKHKKTNYQETLSNPFFFPLFSGNAFNGDVLFKKTNSRILKNTQKILSYIYTQQPWLVNSKIQKTNNQNEKSVVSKPKEEKNNFSFANKLAKSTKQKESSQLNLSQLKLDVSKPKFWNFGSNISFQLMQNHISDNWYKGGESNHSFLAAFNLTANYSNKRKVSFNNKLETKIGFRSTNSDTEHKYMASADLLRLTNQLAVRAINHWDYSLLLQSWTQFTKGYKRNDSKIYSDFMSPFESVLSLGMQYAITSKNKRFNMKLNMSPFAGNFKYVNKESLTHQFGLEDKHTKFEFGSNITMEATWKPFKSVSWITRFYYYSNYKHTRIESENTINFQINRYLSSQIFLYPRFDDQAKRQKDASYIQFKEYLSMGININL